MIEYRCLNEEAALIKIKWLLENNKQFAVTKEGKEWVVNYPAVAI